MEIFPPSKVKVVRVKGKGRGVVATEKIKKGEEIVIDYEFKNNTVDFLDLS